jgi:hypothetical protein
VAWYNWFGCLDLSRILAPRFFFGWFNVLHVFCFGACLLASWHDVRSMWSSIFVLEHVCWHPGMMFDLCEVVYVIRLICMMMDVGLCTVPSSCHRSSHERRAWLSSRELKYLPTITKENVLSRVMGNLLPRELHSAATMHTLPRTPSCYVQSFSHEHVSAFYLCVCFCFSLEQT